VGDEELLHYLSDCWLLGRDSAPWSSYIYICIYKICSVRANNAYADTRTYVAIVEIRS
jgi:hypothetical protein